MADSGLSDPCTRFLPMSRPKSPRMVPGGDAVGLVCPMVFLTAYTAFSASQAMATTGLEVMKSTNPAKKGRSTCSP